MNPPVSLLRRYSAITLTALGLSLAQAGATDPTVVESGEMKLEFQDGWLAKWTNKTSGEVVTFGKPDAAQPNAWVYQPGAWWHPSERPAPADRNVAKWQLDARTADGNAAVVTESLNVPGGLAQAVQWSMKIPLEQLEGVFMPWGLAPARLITKDYHTKNFDEPSYYFEKRTGILSFHEWRQRWYLLQGKTGGLLIYCDDPNFDQRQALEWDFSEKTFMTLTNRSMACAPIKDSFTSSKWVIRQYQGWVNNGVQMYQDFLKSAYHPKPLEERGTKWVTDLAFAINKPAALTPPTFTGPGGTGLNYNSDWPKNLKAAGDWLDELAKVFDPKKVLFYVTAWRQAGNDNNFPSNDIDPFFLYTCKMARERGYHVMLHMHNHIVQDETIFYMRYIRNQSKLMGVPLAENPAEDTPYGVGFDALRNQDMIQRNKEFGSSYYAKMGLDQTMTGFHLHPGWEAYRYMKVANIVAAVQATGADAIHLDVPSIWHDAKDDRFKENVAQGQRELYKLLRETLDKHGLSNVVIATEVMPSEPILPYVDMAQMARSTSVLSLVEGNLNERLLELQIGKDYDAELASRAGKAAANPGASAAPAADKKKKKEVPPFEPELFAKIVGQMIELGQPSILAMANSPWVVGYPHLGNIGPETGGAKDDPNAPKAQNAAQALQIWWALTNNTLPNIQTTVFSDQMVNEGRVGLGRFWEAKDPRLAAPSEWQRGDIARYKLSDGSYLWVTRADPLTLRFNLTGGKVLAELNVFDGWKNDAMLKPYEVPEILSKAAKTEAVKIMEERAVLTPAQ